jgi:hypothetical protein
MKQRLVGLLCVITAVGAFGQGTIDFRNRNTTVTPNVDAPISDIGGATRLSGAAFVAQLMVGATATSLTAVGTPSPFRTGTGAGYWDFGTDFTRTTTLPAGSAAFFLIQVWEASAGSYAAAVAGGFKHGQSNSGAAQPITLGNFGSPPSVPAALAGLQSFSLVPEPTTYALMALGACALLFRRRK